MNGMKLLLTREKISKTKDLVHNDVSIELLVELTKGFSFNKFRLLWVTCEWKGLRPAAADDGAAPDD